jgi:3-phosphoshikimate 1-carboxyvinyltransferase
MARGRAKPEPLMTDPIASPAPLAAHGADPLTGRFAVPGDVSISHRALMLGALTVGRTSLEGLSETAEVMASAAALRQLGVRIDNHDGAWHVHGLGVGGLLEPTGSLNFGSSDAGARLALGLLAPHDFATRIVGGPGLARRSIRPLIEALETIGAGVTDADDGRIPLTWRGTAFAAPIRITMAAPSEEIKSALLLAAAQIAGSSTIHEPVVTRDHTEKLLAAFGADIAVTPDEVGGATIRLVGLTELRPRHLVVPGDPTAAGYAIVAALIVPGSELVIEKVLVNPARTGLIDTLLEMGGDIQFLNQREIAGEHVADLRVRSSRMKGMRVDAMHAAAMLDDIPALAIAAAFAQGETLIEGLGEMREQGGDRLAAIAAGLAASRVTVAEGGDSLSITGSGRVDGGGTVVTRGDYAVAMSFLVMGLASKNTITVDDASGIAAAFPDFVAAMTEIGGRFPPVKGR